MKDIAPPINRDLKGINPSLMKQWKDIDIPQHAVLELHRPTHQSYCNARCHKGGEYGSQFKLKLI